MKLNENFNQQEFIDWISGFLPDFSKDIRKVDVSKSFQGIKSIQTIGESSLGVRVYIIETEQDPSRRKIGLATESFTLLRDYGTPNAIIVYYSENSSLWRLSLLTSTLTWDEGKIKKKLSNPKRQSYVLGSKAKVKTPHQYLINKGSVTDFADLKSRFSLEVVNKEFYKEISSAFIHLVGGQIANGKSKKTVEAQLKLPFVKDHSQTSQEFAVRLIGRIIFCWFLREKRSASGHSLMPRELLSFDASNTIEDYYHKILEPIFFEVLNKPIKTRKDAFINDLFSAIPYLNGGLFSPHEDDFFNYNEGKQAVNHNMVVVPDEWLKSLFEVLETFNFTIDENTSFDEELSIDPEMLGRIFENLLAEINPETGESARKSTGSYYTPRVIVDYMVDESLYLFLRDKTNISEEKLRSLISYDLEDDSSSPLNEEEKDKIAQALGSIKILDPACGSGAFPIGALQKIVFILQQIDQHGQLWFKKQIQNTPIELRKVIEREFQEKNFDYIRKLGIIRENIYGIDIQPIATEISRLRCFLTLVVDERIDDTLENRGIEPLPNLDFKFVTANTLIGLPSSKGLTTQVGLFEDNEGINELKEVRDMFFNSSGFERDQLKLQFYQIQKGMLQRLIDESRRGHADLTSKLTTWDPFSHKTASWFDSEWMFGIRNGFDIVIANPPYINALYMSKNFALDLREYYKTNYRSAKGAYDIYLLFFEAGLRLLNENGAVCFITPNKYLSASYAVAFREMVCGNNSLTQLVDLSNIKVFSEVSTYPVISIYKKVKNKVGDKISTIRLANNDLSDFGAKTFNRFETESSLLSLLPEKIWGFLLSNNIDIVKKLIIDKKPLGLEFHINATSTASEADTYSSVIIDTPSADCVKFINTGTIDPYMSLWGIQDLMNKGKKYRTPYLDLTSNVVSNQRKRLYKSPKIILAKIGLTPEAVYDANGEFGSLNTNCIYTDEKGTGLSVLTAYIHSSIFHFLYKQFFGSLRMGGGYYQFQAPQLKSMPYIRLASKYENEITILLKELNPDTIQLIQKKINNVFYESCELSREQIDRIESEIC